MVKAGVIAPTGRQVALQNAASIASLLLTTEALVSEIQETRKRRRRRKRIVGLVGRVGA